MLTLTVKTAKPEAEILKDDNRIVVTTFKVDDIDVFYKKFNELNANKDITVIPIFISSYGGSVTALTAMLDIIATATKPVATIATGAAMSCGSILLSAGTKGYRFVSPNTEVLIHDVSSWVMGTNTNIQSDAKQINKTNNKVFDILAKNTGKTRKFFLEKLKSLGGADWYLSANQSKSLGLVDHVGMPLLLSK